MSSNDKNKPSVAGNNISGGSQPPPFGNNITQASQPPAVASNTVAQGNQPPVVGNNITGGDSNPPTPKRGTTFRNILIAALAFFAITQMIILILMASKSCTSSHDTTGDIAYATPEKIETTNEQVSNSFDGKHATVLAPEIPDSMKFCGENVSFDRIDIAERLDRELTGTVYGQTLSTLIIKRANRYFPMLTEILKENDAPEDLVYLAVAESSLNIKALSPAGAAGIWQFMPSTGKDYGLEVNEYVDERYDIEKSTVAACKFLKKYYSKFGNWATVCSGYNVGMAGIDSSLVRQKVNNVFDLRLNEETSRYYFRIIAYKIFLSDPKRFGYQIKENQLYQPIEYDIETVDTPVDSWMTWAQEHDITYAQLREANPWIRSTRLPNDSGKVYKVKIPKHDSLYRSTAGNEVFNRNWVVD